MRVVGAIFDEILFHQFLIDVFHIWFEISSHFLLAACSDAIDLVHATVNLFHFEKIDQLRMLSRLSLDLTAIFTTRNMLYFMSAMMWASSTVVVICSVVCLIINTVH